MTLTDYFQLTLEERQELGDKQIKKVQEDTTSVYDIQDSCSFLEQLRAYQLADILGKYKLF